MWFRDNEGPSNETSGQNVPRDKAQDSGLQCIGEDNENTENKTSSSAVSSRTFGLLDET